MGSAASSRCSSRRNDRYSGGALSRPAAARKPDDFRIVAHAFQQSRNNDFRSP